MGQNGDIELLKLKVFLYKFTPQFTSTGSEAEGTLSKIDRFSIELDEKKYFSVYDITDFVSTYSFDQTITDNTFNWSITLHDMPIPFAVLNKNVKISGPDLTNNANSQTMLNLSQYDAEMDNFPFESRTIAAAKLARGKTEAPMVIKVGSTLSNKPGLRLSDIIQKYDVVSCFLYKDITPLDQLKVAIVKDANGFNRASFVPNGRQLTASDLQSETVLLSPGPNLPTEPFFSNEFNGFVMTRSVSRALGAVDSVTITGNGITRLFGSTRRILKSSLMQGSIYNVGSIPNPNAFTAFQNIYAGQLIEAIFADLFQTVYRITFVTSPVTSAFGGGGLSFGPPPQPMVSIPGQNFYDISSLKVSNTFQTNIFTIPPFLLAQVMKRRGFSYRQPTDDAAQTNLELLINEASPADVVSQPVVDSTLNDQASLNPIVSLQDPVEFDEGLNDLRAYFLIFEEVFRDFNAELKTPFEIIDEVKSKTYLEFFERPDGVIIIRSPDYNNTADCIFSSEVGIVDSTYSETAENLVSRHKVAYALDALGTVDPTREYAFTDGKLLLQYGFMETGTDVNPNVQDRKTDDKGVSQTKESGLFEYAQYFMQVGNASLRTGIVKVDLDSSISIGRTFYDERNNKFGYIVGVVKNVQPGSGTPVTMTLRLAFVRDAVIDEDGNLQFENLPRLIDVANKFAGKS